MRVTSAALLLASLTALGSTGCTRGEDVPYVLVVESADIAAASPDGTQWCEDGSAPMVFVDVTAAHASARTSLSEPGPHVEWWEELIVAHQPTFSAGLDIDVFGSCGGAPPFLLGSTWYAPESIDFEWSVTLAPFGSVEALAVRIDQGGYTRSDGYVGYVGDCDVSGCYDDGGGWDNSGYWEDQESYAYDDNGDYDYDGDGYYEDDDGYYDDDDGYYDDDDGYYDDGDGYYDDGSDDYDDGGDDYDDGDYYDDGSDDYDDGSYDDGGGDDGGDDGSDDDWI